MALTKNQYAILAVARRDLRITEAEWRAILARIAHVESATELDNASFSDVMALFHYLGFNPTTAQGKDYGKRSGMATYAQLELIRVLWREYTRGVYDTETELNKWLLRTHKISSLRFMTQDQARKAITGLKAMKARPRAA